MDPDVLALARDCTYGDIHSVLKQSDAEEFPMVEELVVVVVVVVVVVPHGRGALATSP